MRKLDFITEVRVSIIAKHVCMQFKSLGGTSMWSHSSCVYIPMPCLPTCKACLKHCKNCCVEYVASVCTSHTVYVSITITVVLCVCVSHNVCVTCTHLQHIQHKGFYSEVLHT